ncbi:hypothetical protein CEXT_385641 [Caerostris extrusa]|uniref:Uncharacterized protein n=1 Tax=Caerostris extrusa TaxID=172846 RepID=A0AAV4S4P0_CAEEX|nr:hypothetical protein CEXT_385641 [Caerostris extrusa]
MYKYSEVIVFLAGLKWISVQYPGARAVRRGSDRLRAFPHDEHQRDPRLPLPPLLPGLMEIPEVKQMLLKATKLFPGSSVEKHVMTPFATSRRRLVRESIGRRWRIAIRYFYIDSGKGSPPFCIHWPICTCNTCPKDGAVFQ